jgi:pimeloyl-ACP methyl ester carboxylesterase
MEIRERKVKASGIDFQVLEMGEGPLVLCLHGFPDTAHSFRHQMPAMARAGFRVAAPFMRGYRPSGAAPDGRYDSGALSEDALALIAALGEKEAILFGHDWGAVAAYGAAASGGDKIRKIVTAAVPYGGGMFRALLTNPAQQRRSWYFFFFQTDIADAAVAYNDFEFLEHLWRDWSPGWRWTRDDIEPLKRCFRERGTLEAALGYYRATLGAVFKMPLGVEQVAAMPTQPISAPAMMIHGQDDGCIGVELLEGMGAHFTRGLRTEVIAGAGHFVHQERPDEVNRLILDFLKS